MYSENLTHNTFNQSGVAITERTQGWSTGRAPRVALAGARMGSLVAILRGVVVEPVHIELVVTETLPG